jgi:hypothetical protein
MTKKVDSSAKMRVGYIQKIILKIITNTYTDRITSLEKLNIYSCIKLLKEKKIRLFEVVDVSL